MKGPKIAYIRKCMPRWEAQRRHLLKVPAKFVHPRSLLWDTLKTSRKVRPKFAIVLLVIWELTIRNKRDCPFILDPVERGSISENLEICVNGMTLDLMNNNLLRPMHIQMPKYHSLLFVYPQRHLVIQVMHIEKKKQCLRSEHAWRRRSG